MLKLLLFIISLKIIFFSNYCRMFQGPTSLPMSPWNKMWVRKQAYFLAETCFLGRISTDYCYSIECWGGYTRLELDNGLVPTRQHASGCLNQHTKCPMILKRSSRQLWMTSSHKKLHIIIDDRRNFYENMSNFVVSTVPADGPAPTDALVNWAIIGSGNGLSPIWCQDITWNNAGLLSIRLLGTNFRKI